MEKMWKNCTKSHPSNNLVYMMSVLICSSDRAQELAETSSDDANKRKAVGMIPEEDTSTVCSPSTPAPKKLNTTHSPSQNRLDDRFSPISHETAPVTSSRWYTNGLSDSVARDLEKVICLLWNRDDMIVGLSYSPYTPDYLKVRNDSLKYIKTYLSSLEALPDDPWPVILAGIFLAFKSADNIPGKGRVRMNQLLDAFDRSTARQLEEPMIQAICRIEMKMMCQCNFRFD